MTIGYDRERERELKGVRKVMHFCLSGVMFNKTKKRREPEGIKRIKEARTCNAKRMESSIYIVLGFTHFHLHFVAVHPINILTEETLHLHINYLCTCVRSLFGI